MATKERIEVLDLDYGQVGHRFFEKYTLAPLPGKSFHVTPRYAKPYKSYYINGGCATVSVNTGAPESVLGIERQFRSTFLNNVTDPFKGGDWKAFTTDDAKSAAQNCYNGKGGYHFITSGAEEPRYDGDPGAMLWEWNPNAYREFNRELSRLAEANGGRNAGSYDGIYYPDTATEISAVRTALQSNQAAFNYMQAHTYNRHPYFTEKGWEWEHPTLNVYFRSRTDVHRRNLDLIISLVLTRMALNHAATINPVAATKEICCFYFDGKTEFVHDNREGFSQRWNFKHNNITVEEYNFPDYSTAYQLNVGFYGTDLAQHLFGWEDWRMYSASKDRFEEPFQRFDGFWMRAYRDQNGNLTTALPLTQAKNPYDPNHAYPYPSTYDGSKEYAAVGRKQFELGIAHIGAMVPGEWAVHSTTTGAYCSGGASYLADRQEDGLMLARRYRNGNKVMLKVDDFRSSFSGPVERKIDLGNGQSDVFLVYPNASNIWKVTL